MTYSYPEYAPPSIAATVYGVKPPTLRRWAKDGKIGFIKTPGGQFRYDVRSHLALMSAASVPAPAAKPAPERKTVTVKPAKVSPSKAAAATIMYANAVADTIPEPPAMTAEQIAAMQALLTPKTRPTLPEGVELRSIGDEPEVTMREWNPAPKPEPKPEPVKVKPAAKPTTGRKSPPVKLSKEELARQLDALAG